jgi:hypothetical protein
MGFKAFFQSDGNELDKEARRMCMTCPVQDYCREYADDTLAIGIWGGMNERERLEARRRRRRRKSTRAG